MSRADLSGVGGPVAEACACPEMTSRSSEAHFFARRPSDNQSSKSVDAAHVARSWRRNGLLDCSTCRDSRRDISAGRLVVWVSFRKGPRNARVNSSRKGESTKLFGDHVRPYSTLMASLRFHPQETTCQSTDSTALTRCGISSPDHPPQIHQQSSRHPLQQQPVESLVCVHQPF